MFMELPLAYEHKAHKSVELLEVLSGIQMLTELDRETVEKVHMDKTENPQDVVDEWISNDPDVKILVLDKGNKLAFYLTQDFLSEQVGVIGESQDARRKSTSSAHPRPTLSRLLLAQVTSYPS